MPDSTNPFTAVGSPNYAAPMLDWQKMAQGIAGGLTGQPRQVTRPPITPAQGPQGATAGQPTQAQQQMQGLGARLRAMFGPQTGMPLNIAPPNGANVPAYGPGIGPGGPVPLMPPQGNPGLY